jgi:hypothetical protein
VVAVDVVMVMMMMMMMMMMMIGRLHRPVGGGLTTSLFWNRPSRILVSVYL